MKKFLLLLFLLPYIVAPVSADEPVGTLIIPSLSLYRPVDFVPLIDKNYDLTQLGYGVGHLEGTSWDDPAWGRTVLVGHTPGGFSTLDKLQNDAIIYLLTDTYTFVYQVTGQYVTTPDDVGVLMPTDQASLVLMTCTNGTQQRLITVASLTEVY